MRCLLFVSRGRLAFRSRGMKNKQAKSTPPHLFDISKVLCFSRLASYPRCASNQNKLLMPDPHVSDLKKSISRWWIMNTRLCMLCLPLQIWGGAAARGSHFLPLMTRAAQFNLWPGRRLRNIHRGVCKDCRIHSTVFKRISALVE